MLFIVCLRRLVCAELASLTFSRIGVQRALSGAVVGRGAASEKTMILECPSILIFAVGT